MEIAQEAFHFIIKMLIPLLLMSLLLLVFTSFFKYCLSERKI